MKKLERKFFMQGLPSEFVIGKKRIREVAWNPGYSGNAPQGQTCQQTHLFMVLNGRGSASFDDGTAVEFGPGDFVYIGGGHVEKNIGEGIFHAIALEPPKGTVAKAVKKNFTAPDFRDVANGAVRDFIIVGATEFTRVTAKRGWRWSDKADVEKTDTFCAWPHYLQMLSGRMAFKLKDESASEFTSGDFGFIPARHDAWTVGDEDAVYVEFRTLAKATDNPKLFIRALGFMFKYALKKRKNI